MRHEDEICQIEVLDDATKRHQIELCRVGHAVSYGRAETHAGQIDRYDVVLGLVCQKRRYGLEAVRVVQEPVQREYGLADAQLAKDLPAYLAPAAFNLKLLRLAR